MLPPRVRRLFRLDIPDRARLAAEVDEEIAFHIEQRTRQLIARGMSSEEARAEAVRRFGQAYLVERSIHSSARRREDRMRLTEWRDALAHDIRYALRVLRGAPGFTAVVTLTLALGIGATTAMFSVLDAVLLRPLPYPEPERLVVLSDVQGETPVPASYPEFVDWRRNGTGIFDEVGGYFPAEVSLTGRGEPEILRGIRGSAEVHRMLGTAVLHGRMLTAEDDPRSSAAAALISEGLWRRRFGADPSTLGRTLTLNGASVTVVGIVRSSRRAVHPQGLVNGETPEVWLPLRLTEEIAPRGLHFMTVLARLRPGLAPAHARARVDELAARLREAGAATHGMALTPLADRLVGDVRTRLTLLLAAVSVVLLIACVNVANLLTARAAARHREIAVRVAIGAGRSRVVSQLLVESVVRSLLGGALGVLLAFGALAIMRRWLVGGLPRAEEIVVDGRVLLFALALSVITGLLFGLLPSLRAVGRDTADALREGARGMAGSAGRDRIRTTLVTAEVALSFVLLAGAALLIQSFGRLAATDNGFEDERVLTALILLPSSHYADSTRQIAFFGQLLERAAALPSVRGAALASDLPVEGGTNGGFSIEGRTFPPDAQPLAEKRIVSANYFEVLGARIVDGRTFEPRDALGAPGAMIVNESFARTFFPEGRAVGQRVAFSWGTEGMQTVIGVVADIREGPLDQPPAPAMYVPVAQRASDAMRVLLRTSGDPLQIVPALRRAVAAIDPDLPLSQVRTLSEVVTSGIAGQRLAATLTGIFSVVALLLAAVGLYGVISFSVVQRTHELGIRTALGARRGDVIRLVLGQGAVLIGAGLIVGLLLALASQRLLATQLYGIAADDATTLVFVAAVLTTVGIAAAAVPAARAARIDPMVALRQE